MIERIAAARAAWLKQIEGAASFSDEQNCGFIAGWQAALADATQAHEADKQAHEAEKREQAQRFSEAAAKVVEQFGSYGYNKLNVSNLLSPFIIPQADPLVEALAEGLFERIAHGDEEHRAWLKAEMQKAVPEVAKARGLHIVAKGGE